MKEEEEDDEEEEGVGGFQVKTINNKSWLGRTTTSLTAIIRNDP